MEKLIFEAPEAEIIEFTDDIIVTSGDGTIDDDFRF